MIIYTTDNKDWHKPDNICQQDIDNLAKIADIKIDKLSLDERENLLIFPHDFATHGDKIHDQSIISLNKKDEIKTGNIMGFVGVNDTQLDIKSRFAKDDTEDYFLHYMLQKVFRINLFDIKHTSSHESLFDFLIYLFPSFLQRAMSRGLFKKYRRNEYNDANVRGTINVSRHIRMNIPFGGRLAYSTREHCYDNEITQLIRHTIEYIGTKPAVSHILNNDKETKACISQIMEATPSYNLRNRTKVIGENLKPLNHPYYSEYTPLQKLCLQILRHETIKFGSDKDKVYGILFDGAWLWEEYLWTILKEQDFKHPENKNSCGGFRMFEKPEEDDLFDNNSRKLYPDFYKDNFILDAKYKHLENGVGREDLYQVVTYMYCKKAVYGGYIYPCAHEQESKSYKLNGYEGTIHIMPFYVPKGNDSFENFCKTIQDSENKISNDVADKQQHQP